MKKQCVGWIGWDTLYYRKKSIRSIRNILKLNNIFFFDCLENHFSIIFYDIRNLLKSFFHIWYFLKFNFKFKAMKKNKLMKKIFYLRRNISSSHFNKPDFVIFHKIQNVENIDLEKNIYKNLYFRDGHCL